MWNEVRATPDKAKKVRLMITRASGSMWVSNAKLLSARAAQAQRLGPCFRIQGFSAKWPKWIPMGRSCRLAGVTDITYGTGGNITGTGFVLQYYSKVSNINCEKREWE